MGHIDTPIDRHTDTPMYRVACTDVPGGLYPGTNISFLVAREAKRLAYYDFPPLAYLHKIDHFGTLAPRC